MQLMLARWGCSLWLAALLLPIAFSTSFAQTHRDSATVTLRGFVVTMPGDRPVPGAVVTLLEAHRSATASALGAYEFVGLAPGTYSIGVRRIGFVPLFAQLDLQAGKVIEADLELDQIKFQTLDRVIVADRAPDVTGFAERKRTSAGGTFLTASLFDSLGAEPLFAVLEGRIAGARIVRSGSGGEYRLATARGLTGLGAGGSCYSQVFVDGIRIYTPGSSQPVPDLREFDTQQLEGVEFYAGPATTPPQFGGSGAACGTLLIWHKAR